jgi:hypothetical protein
MPGQLGTATSPGTAGQRGARQQNLHQISPLQALFLYRVIFSGLDPKEENIFSVLSLNLLRLNEIRPKPNSFQELKGKGMNGRGITRRRDAGAPRFVGNERLKEIRALKKGIKNYLLSASP